MLEDLEKKIYSREGVKREAENSSPAYRQAGYGGWSEKLKSKDSALGRAILKFSRFWKIFFWSALSLIIIFAGFSGFYIYKYLSSDRETSFEVIGPDKALAGVPFDLLVRFDNGSKDVLENAVLSVFLPEGGAVLGEDSDKLVFFKEIGAVESGTGFQEKVPLVVFSEGLEVKKFGVSVSYSSVLKSRFEKKTEVEVMVKEAGVKLDMLAPEKVLNNEEFEAKIRYSNVSDIDFSGVRLFIDLPKSFVLKKSEPQILSGGFSGNFIEIGDLQKGKEGEVLIAGKIIGPERSFFEINSRISALYKGGSFFEINSKTASVNIAPSPLSLKIFFDGSGNAVFPSQSLKFRVAYQNSADIGLKDAIIKLKLSGEMFDFSSLQTDGFFDSRTNAITWNAAGVPGLLSIEPTGSGEVDFEINVKENYPIRRLSDKNFVLKAEAEISSPTVPYYVSADKTVGFDSLKIKIAGSVFVGAAAYFKESFSGFSNAGVLPPKVDQPTNFTIRWTIMNYSTDVKNVLVKASLLSGVKLIGAIKSNISSSPVYNERTGEISWTIDRIPAAKGIVNKSIEAIFQVEAIPNITQVGKEMPLLSETMIGAFDEFVGIELAGKAEALTTGSLADFNFDKKIGEVVN